MDEFDPQRYTVAIKLVSLDVGDRFEAAVTELPDVVEYAPTPDAAYALALDAIATLKGAAVETGATFPDPRAHAADQIRAYEPVLPGEDAPATVAEVWPTLDKPAAVGSAEFAIGVSCRLVVAAAQRAYQYAGEHRDLTPDEAAAQERIRRARWDARNGALTAAAVGAALEADTARALR